MRTLFAGLSITLMTLFTAIPVLSAQAASDDEVVSTSTESEECKLTTTEEESSTPSTDVVVEDEEATEDPVEMACWPKYTACSINSQCCSGICKTYGMSYRFCL